MTYDYNQFLIDLILKGDYHLIDNINDHKMIEPSNILKNPFPSVIDYCKNNH